MYQDYHALTFTLAMIQTSYSKCPEKRIGSAVLGTWRYNFQPYIDLEHH